jgi:hypothetical protein
MHGKILTFSAHSEDGLIAGDDGIRYKFQKSSWAEASYPRALVRVTFETKGDTAIAVQKAPLSRSERAKVVLALALILPTLMMWSQTISFLRAHNEQLSEVRENLSVLKRDLDRLIRGGGLDGTH